MLSDDLLTRNHGKKTIVVGSLTRRIPADRSHAERSPDEHESCNLEDRKNRKGSGRMGKTKPEIIIWKKLAKNIRSSLDSRRGSDSYIFHTLMGKSFTHYCTLPVSQPASSVLWNSQREPRLNVLHTCRFGLLPACLGRNKTMLLATSRLLEAASKLDSFDGEINDRCR